ncbi:unnamed protein product [Leptosia nina]|uniref:Uncharacterized protein n=1 Tax=Leptosia nina TaxID=320188 RepID=A0AAV1K5J6_9NEOP
MAPGRKAGAINSGDSGNPAGGRCPAMAGIHSLYCTVLYSSLMPTTLAPNILAALRDTSVGNHHLFHCSLLRFHEDGATLPTVFIS